ncbi:MAG: metallophosphoesterase, partial [Oscillospiraceae bacterium]|nr:metallophosphoesterase [Oscillospiraceae bacterium]
MTGAVTQGRKPTIYSRGNHEIRGSNCEDLPSVSGYSETTGAYYTVTMPGIFGIVLDAGEDKVDSHAEYGGTVQFAAYRDAQTKWLREVLKSREWEKYPVRMAFCHVPFGFYAADTFESVYKEWSDLLDQMGVSLQISGHKHYYGLYTPNSTKYKSDPNYYTLLMSDRENGDYTYSGSFVTVGKEQYQIENILQNLTVRASKTVPQFTNAYISSDGTTGEAASLAEAGPSASKAATRASVPAISSPYTLHPTVFAVEDGYQIIFPTETTGMAWVEVGGTKYYDTTSGLMRYTSKYHSIRVPRVALDAARSYKTCYQSMVYREAYSPTHGSTASRTYPFTPMADKKEPVILCLSDFRGLAAEAKAAAGYKAFDALYIGGDYTYNGNTEANVKILLDTASALTSGTKPVFFTRGNREVRGNYARLLDQIAPTSKTGKSYYTVEQADFFAIVLDSGEDKLDSHAEYGGTVDYEALRKEQTRWLRQVLAEGKWKDYPTRVAFCHMPVTRMNATGLREEFAQWTELLDQMGISLMISGHNYNFGLYSPDHSSMVSDPEFATLVCCDVDNADYTYSASFVTLGYTDIKIENASAAKKLLQTVTTPNLTAPTVCGESDPYLMFDFNNDPVALQRYHSFVYGGINFDLKSNWDHEANTAASSISRGVLSFSPASGTVTSVGVYSRPLNNSKGQWAYRPLHYFTKPTDYCQVRFKIDNAVATTADGTAIFRLDVDCPNDLNDVPDVSKTYTRFEQSFSASDVVGKGYVTLSFPLNTTEYNNIDFMNLVHPQFVNLKSVSGGTAVYSIDYIYIGPEDSFPKQEDHLFFDFENTEADRERYNSFTYNYMNFDEPACWTAYNGSPLSTIRDGALCLAVPTGNTDESHSIRSHRDNARVIHYVPGQEDILQVRIQIRNAAASTQDGMVEFAMDLDRSNTLVLSDGTSRAWTRVSIPFKLADYVDQGWFTLETPLTNWEYLQSDCINLVHPNFRYMTNASGKTAEFLIDYIYIGPEGKSPTANTVTFCAEDGTVLEEHKVATGGSVSYGGAVPVKTYDEDKHYSFAGWVDEAGKAAALDNITESLTLYPSFKGEGHIYEEQILTAPSCSAEGVKELHCACGYSYREVLSPTAHTPGIIAAVAPSCTEPGMSEGSYCTVCQAVITVPVEVPPLGHAPETIPGYAATCLNSGLSDGAECSRCSIILTEQVIIPRLGHAMTYTDLGETHLARCTRCNKESTQAHSFTDGSCICGKKENTHLTEKEDWKLYHSLNLASDISVNYLIPASAMEGFDMDTVFVDCRYYEYEGNEQSTEQV